ncbi:hypothetical protein [uncultured Methylobacterium sp.]|uniref:hypothetical protein n=1 Tax=uncultured Methylobacterium sp. TaxID=157278 RepID=UPI002635DEB3|nr:hypothetical protein [uncultured Methylobacterium sp.]
MTMRISTAFVVGALLSTAALAQTVDTPQRSREQAPNMPPAHETVPERVRPTDPDATGTTRGVLPPAEAPKTTDGVLRPQKTSTGE